MTTEQKTLLSSENFFNSQWNGHIYIYQDSVVFLK